MNLIRPENMKVNNSFHTISIILAVNEILQDLQDRRGLRQAWEEIDIDVQNEIRDEWAKIIFKNLSPDA